MIRDESKHYILTICYNYHEKNSIYNPVSHRVCSGSDG